MGTETEKETSLEDDIRSALEASEEDGGSSEQPRDEAGKFTAKENESEVEAAARLEPEKTKEAPAAAEPGKETQPQQEQQPILTQDKAPQGWSPTMREKWGTIPEDVRKEILRREEDSVKGVRQLQERYAPMEQFVRGLEPFLNEARQAGVAPDNYIGAVLSSERVLRMADLPGKFQEILRIADQYGVPLREVINASVGQEILTKGDQQQQVIPPAVQQELQEMRQWRAQFENNNAQATVEEFAKDKEFIKDVHLHMAALIEGGAAKDLQDAYDMACWANPEIRAILTARETGKKMEEGFKQRQSAAAGASVKPNASIDVKTENEDEDLEDTVRAAFASQTSGRV